MQSGNACKISCGKHVLHYRHMNNIAMKNIGMKDREQAIFSIRSILFFFGWLCLWQGWHVEGSIFQFNFLLVIFSFVPVFLHELILILTFILLILYRIMSEDYTL